jgi:hypothetical protein
LYLMQVIPASETTPFQRTVESEVCKEDKDFIGKIMMMYWRDRPTAEALLEDWNYGIYVSLPGNWSFLVRQNSILDLCLWETSKWCHSKDVPYAECPLVPSSNNESLRSVL